MANVTPAQLRRGYGPIYRWLSRCGTQLEASEKIVLLNLLERQGQNASAWPLQKTIGEDTGFSDRHVRRALRGLEEHGFISTRRSAPGEQNVYEVVLEAILDAAEHRTHGDSLSADHRTPMSAPSGHDMPDPPDTHVRTLRTPMSDGLSLVEDSQGSLPNEVTNRSGGGGVLLDFLQEIGVAHPARWSLAYSEGALVDAMGRLLASLPAPFIVYDDDDPSAVRRRKFSTTWQTDDGREATLMERCEAAGIHNPAGLVRSWLQSGSTGRRPSAKGATHAT